MNPASQNWLYVYLLRNKENGKIYIVVNLRNILNQRETG